MRARRLWRLKSQGRDIACSQPDCLHIKAQGARPAIYFCQHGAATVRVVQMAPAPPVKGSKEKQARSTCMGFS